MDRIAIVGRSKVGRSIAQAIRIAGRDKLTAIIPARSSRYPPIDAEIVIIATRDAMIANVARKAIKACVTPPRLLVHVAGSRSPEILPEIGRTQRLTMHPIQTFARPAASLLDGIYWMVSSSDKAAVRWARRFTASLGAKAVIELPKEQLTLYHATTVFSSNFITLLLAAVEELSETLGQSDRRMKSALKPLINAAVENALKHPAVDVLTGPIKRHDLETIEAHRTALQKTSADLRKIYDAFLNYGWKL